MVLILGIGNSLLQDEGVGYHLLNRLTQEKAHWPVEFLDGGTMSFSLTRAIESCSYLIVIDAANLNQTPGTIEVFQNAQLDNFLSSPGKSVHEVSLSDLFDMVRLTESLPSHRAMIAIQPQDITWGENLTPAVAAAMDEAVEKIEQLLKTWGVLGTANTAAPNDSKGNSAFI